MAKSRDVEIVLAGCRAHVRAFFQRCDFYETIPMDRWFVNTQSAVDYANTVAQRERSPNDEKKQLDDEKKRGLGADNNGSDGGNAGNADVEEGAPTAGDDRKEPASGAKGKTRSVLTTQSSTITLSKVNELVINL